MVEGSLIVATNYSSQVRSRPFVDQNFTSSFNPDLPPPSPPIPVPLRHLVSQTPVTLQTRRPPIDVRVNERRPRQQRVTEPGGQAFCSPSSPFFPRSAPDMTTLSSSEGGFGCLPRMSAQPAAHFDLQREREAIVDW